MKNSIETGRLSTARHPAGLDERAAVASPDRLVRRAERLAGRRDQYRQRVSRLDRELARLNEYLRWSEPVTDALRTLGEQLFEEVLGTLQSRLSVALQDVLEQPIELKATADFKRGGAVVEFAIEREGNAEDIRRGQGGSVANVLSVGLRLFALATLDEKEHRRFLVLDEQDCWLRPDLVPRLVQIVSQAARDLGFQVLMISHHDVQLFDQYADRIYRLEPDGSRVAVRQVSAEPAHPDIP